MNIKHYYIVVFINKDGIGTMLLSHPELKEIDVSGYMIK